MLPQTANDHSLPFYTKDEVGIPGVTQAEWTEMFRKLIDDFGINISQVVEAASYSMAMVVRYALGLSAQSGSVGCIFRDGLSGWITLATLRHLANAGANVWAVRVGNATNNSEALTNQLRTLERMGVQIATWSSTADNQELEELIINCHNVLCGIYISEMPLSPDENSIIDILNENQTPIHCVEVPVGINADTGQCSSHPLFASSTLSLGAPIAGLAAAYDYVGRHYLCDISFCRQLSSFDFGAFFAEQPVFQIFSSERKRAEAEL